MGKMLNLLLEGDRRTVGRVADAVRLALDEPKHIAELMDLLTDPRAEVRMRASDALEKATVQRSDLLAPHKDHLLELTEDAVQSEVRWHLAQIVTRLDLERDEIDDLSHVFSKWFRRAASKIVRTAALQAMFDLAQKDGRLIGPAQQMLEDGLNSPVPALCARARKLKGPLERLKAAQEGAPGGALG